MGNGALVALACAGVFFLFGAYGPNAAATPANTHMGSQAAHVQEPVTEVTAPSGPARYIVVLKEGSSLGRATASTEASGGDVTDIVVTAGGEGYVNNPNVKIDNGSITSIEFR